MTRAEVEVKMAHPKDHGARAIQDPAADVYETATRMSATGPARR
jgi:hypothetical protein